MVKKTAIAIVIAGVAATFTACNDDYVPQQDISTSVIVSSFKLRENDKILANLDTVFFSIDLVNARIFNADSLPYGTKVTRLVPEIGLGDGVSVATLHFARTNKPDTVVDYITNPKDTIDFSQGPVRLHLVSPDGGVTRDYTIKVNVHKIEADTLEWSQAARMDLPSTLGTLTAQCTAKSAGLLYCLTTDGTDYCMAVTDNPYMGQWRKQKVTFGFTPDVESLRGSDDALYILSDNGDMYTSTDGISWSATGRNWKYIYGSYGSTIIGVTTDGTQWTRCYYPGTRQEPVESDFPVSGTTLPVAYTFPLSTSMQTVMAGGRLANGEIVGTVWSFDGTNWAKISLTNLPKLEGMVIVPYYTFAINDAFVATRWTSLLAMCGRNKWNENNRKVYVSRDFGQIWQEAADKLQMSPDFPAIAGAQAFVYTTTMTADGPVVPAPVGLWQELGGSKALNMPPMPGYGDMTTYAVSPITQWQTPFIYIFGGYSEEGALYNNVWRGVINRLLFKPIQ